MEPLADMTARPAVGRDQQPPVIKPLSIRRQGNAPALGAPRRASPQDRVILGITHHGRTDPAGPRASVMGKRGSVSVAGL